MIDIKNISKVYKTKSGELTAVDDVNLSTAKGEIFGIRVVNDRRIVNVYRITA